MIPESLKFNPPAPVATTEPSDAKKFALNALSRAIGLGELYTIAPPAPEPAPAETPPDPAPAPPTQEEILAELAEVRTKLDTVKRARGYVDPTPARDAAQSAADQRKAALDAAIKARADRREAQVRAKIARQGRKLGLLP